MDKGFEMSRMNQEKCDHTYPFDPERHSHPRSGTTRRMQHNTMFSCEHQMAFGRGIALGVALVDSFGHGAERGRKRGMHWLLCFSTLRCTYVRFTGSVLYTVLSHLKAQADMLLECMVLRATIQPHRAGILCYLYGQAMVISQFVIAPPLES